MILDVHSEASYLLGPKRRSCVGGHFFLGSMPTNSAPIHLNAPIHATCGIIRLVAVSAAEAGLAALFLNVKETKILPLTLEEMGYPRPKTPIHVDNATVTGIVNSTIKRKRSQLMEMRYFWLLDQACQKYMSFIYHPGLENLGDYYTKAFFGKNMQQKQPLYVHKKRSPRTLLQAQLPHTRRGCVGIIRD